MLLYIQQLNAILLILFNRENSVQSEQIIEKCLNKTSFIQMLLSDCFSLTAMLMSEISVFKFFF